MSAANADFERLLAEAVEARLDEELAAERARRSARALVAFPDTMKPFQRLWDALEEARRERAAGEG